MPRKTTELTPLKGQMKTLKLLYKMTELLTNTKQWAKYTINLFKGRCANGCIYCYRNADITRFRENPEWRIKADPIFKTFKKRDGVTLYPSAHDIRYEDLTFHISFLANFLASGSNIIIVTKPDYYCIAKLCESLEIFKNQIEFRFTIGSYESDILNFYEPNASTFTERFFSVRLVYLKGYKTSISIEPMLDLYPERVIEKVLPFVTEHIWIGKINLAKIRLTLNGHADKWEQVSELVNWQANDQNILELVQRLSVYPKIKWKDSIQKVIDNNLKLKKLCQA